MSPKLIHPLTIGIVSPAYFPGDERFQGGIEYLKQSGCTIKLGQHLGARYGYFAGRDEQRVADLHAMYRDKEVDIILCTRGGWGGLRLIHLLNYQLIGENRKPLIGYSDITTLQLAIWTKAAVPSLSGPMLAVEMGSGISDFTATHFWGQLLNPNLVYDFNFMATRTTVLRPGQASGRLLGGCLSLVTSLLGTPYCPEYGGSVLFLEDTGEKPYRIDRYLAHLRQAGIFDKISGLILGEFLDCDAGEGEISFTVMEILRQYFSGANFPVLLNFPYGHGADKFSLPLGALVTLDTSTGGISLENPFRLFPVRD